MENVFENSPDLYIWKSFKEGNKQAYAYMYKKYAPALYNYGCKISPDKELVEDCIQDLFIHILLHRSNLGD